MAVTEKWHGNVDKGGVFGILLSDLSKAFDCLLHELLTAKLHVYGFDMKLLNPIHNYMLKRKQSGKVGGSYSSC